MKNNFFHLLLALLTAILLIPAASAASASPVGKNAKINQILVENVPTPTFNSSEHGVNSTDFWCKICLDYTLNGDKNVWTDDVEIRWYVGIKADNGSTYYIMSRSIKYCNIDTNKKRHAAVYLSPRFFARYLTSKRSEPTRVGVYAELYVNDKLVDSKDRRASGMRDEWWKTAEKIKRIDSALLPKQRTPFCWMDTQYYDEEIPIRNTAR